MAREFLPMTTDEAGGPVDVVLVTGDAYVDHPAWGAAAIGRWLEEHGFSVGIIAQPDWTDVAAFQALGRPNLFFGVTAGNMDTQVNRYTASRRLRNNDAYAPGGTFGLRPDRASIPYTARVKQAFKGVPVVLGGIEASLRRFAHFDFWQDRLRGSILLDAKADLLIHGMGEYPVLEIARRLAAGRSIAECRDIPGTAYAPGAKDALPADLDPIELPSLEACREDPRAANTVTREMYRQSNPHSGRVLVQPHGARRVVANRPALPLSTADMDRLHELPFAGRAHPCYLEPIPALQSIQGSITVNRGCAGGCAFCALTIHQGKDVTSRSEASVLRELDALTQRPDFNGIVSDLGGPTANMFHMKCNDERANQVCRRVSCLHPVRCKHYGTDHGPYRQLLRKAREFEGVRKVFVNSGIRYDLASLDDGFVEELTEHHVPGQLSVAPEHASKTALDQMKKPGIDYFTEFMQRFEAANRKHGKKQFLVPYFQCAHPGVGPAETIELAQYMKRHGLRPRQVQMFMPTPATLATATWYSGIDPMTDRPVFVARGGRERSRQRALLFYWKREEWPHVREALKHWGRADLIGVSADALVPPGPSYAAASQRERSVRYDTHEGMQVERATRDEESEMSWEGVAQPVAPPDRPARPRRRSGIPR
jgi:uncharacterized radical SAM protein YgiQ